MISSTTARDTYTGNGAVDTYAFSFRITNKNQIEVVVRNTATPPVETVLTVDTDYTVSGVREASGSIALVNSGQAWLDSDGDLRSGYRLTIRLDEPNKQETDFRNQGTYYPDSHENSADHLVRCALSLQDQVSRSIKQPKTDDPSLDMTLPAASSRASTFLAFDADGKPIASDGGFDSVPVSPFMETLLDDTSASAARSTLGVSGLPRSVKDAAYGAVGDGVTNDTAAINAAIAVGPGVVYFPPGTYACTTGFLCNTQNVKLVGEGKSSKIVLPDGQKIYVTASGFEMAGLWVDGSSATTHTSSSRLVEVQGTSPSSRLTHIHIHHCLFTNAPYYGIRAQFCDKISVCDNFVDGVGQGGIYLSSCNNFHVDRNDVRNINTDHHYSNSYPIIVSEDQSNNGASFTTTLTSGSATAQVTAITDLMVGDVIVSPGEIPPGTTIIAIGALSGTYPLTLSAKAIGNLVASAAYFSHPPSENGTMDSNVIDMNPVWEGLDCHSGRNISISNNTIKNCKMGIVVGDSGANFGMAPQNITVQGNSIQGFCAEDDTKTCTGSSTTITMSAAPNFTVRPGNYVIFGAQVRRIATVTNQTTYVLASSGNDSGAFSPQPSASACIVTQKGCSTIAIAITGDETTSSVATSDEFSDGCTIADNGITYFGGQEDALGSAIYVRNTRGCTIAGNSMVNIFGYGILAYYQNFGLVVDGNSCVDTVSYSKTDVQFLRFGADYNTAVVSGNMIKVGSAAYASYLAYHNVQGISYSATTDYCELTLGDNYFDGSSFYLAGAPARFKYDSAVRKPNHWSDTIPTTGTWQRGDFVNNTAAAVNGTRGWICTAAGSPGTWLVVPVVATTSTLQVGLRITAKNTLTSASTDDAVVEAQAEGTAGDSISQYTFISTTDKWAAGMKRTDKTYRVGYDAGDATHGRLGVADFLQITTAGVITLGTGTATTHRLNTTVQSTVGAAGAGSALPATPEGFILININGTNRAIPYYLAS